MFSIDIPDYVKTVLDRIKLHGFEAYLVGGCVRDSILNIKPNDYDISTSAKPNEIIDMFSDYTMYNKYSLEHGVVKLSLSNKCHVDVATFRFNVDFVKREFIFSDNISDDLHHRDITINAIAYDGEKLIDSCDGINDLKNRIIKSIKDPYIKFNEEPHVILRILRFALKYDFIIDKNTYSAALDSFNLISLLPSWKIRKELYPILLLDDVNKLVKPELRKLLCCAIPELEVMFDFDQQSKWHKHDLWEHTVSVMQNVSPILTLRLAALFHDIGKYNCNQKYFDEKDNRYRLHFKGHAKESAVIAKNVLTRLRYDNNMIDDIVFLIENHDIPLGESKRSVNKLLSIIPVSKRDTLFNYLIELRRADRLDHIYTNSKSLPSLDRIVEIKKDIDYENSRLTLKKLLIDGYDMIKIGYKDKQIGIILNEILNNVLNGTLENDRAVLLEYAKDRFKKD